MNKLVLFLLVLFGVLIIGPHFYHPAPQKRLVVEQRGPTRAPVPDPHPNPPDRWRLTEDGLGPIRIGATPQHVQEELGDYFHAVNDDAGPINYAEWPGAPVGVRVCIHGGVVQQIVVDKPGVRTDQGAVVGDTAEQVIAAYNGKISATMDSDHRVITATDHEPADAPRGLAFMLNWDKRVLVIRAGPAWRTQSDDCRG